MAETQAFLEEIDLMFHEKRLLQSYDKLKPFIEEYLTKTEEKDWDKGIIMRWARALYYYGKFFAPKEEKETIIQKGLDYAQKLVREDYGYGHLWYAVLLDGKSELHGQRARISTLVPVEEHLRKAAELLPNDPVAIHGLGKFMFEIADVSWILKSLIKMVYGGKALPVCTYELALEKFLKAEEIVPDFYSMNTCYIGRCYFKLKQNEKAIPYLKKAAKWEVKISDDEEAKNHAIECLKQLGVKDF